MGSAKKRQGRPDAGSRDEARLSWERIAETIAKEQAGQGQQDGLTFKEIAALVPMCDVVLRRIIHYAIANKMVEVRKSPRPNILGEMKMTPVYRLLK